MRTKSIVTISVAAAVMIYGASAFAADKNFGTGTVTFRGTILDAPCDIATGDDKLDVDFGQVSYKSLKTANIADDAHAKNFTIRLQNCDFEKAGPEQQAANPGGLMSKVMVSFSGTATGDKKAFLSTDLYNQSLGVQLTNAKGDIIPSHAAAVPADFADESEIQLRTGGINELTYTAKLINVGREGSVKPGAFAIPVNYTLKYQ
ncbi:fimbrial protein StdA [Salmonella enterica]|nr:fimbrial protein StdA [Salmonella enterica]